MQEDFLHHVWLHKKFALESLQTTENQSIIIKSVGLPNVNSGPDFFNAQIYIDDQLWVGTVEIHLQSSDWYVHHHEKDPAYDNVILHVVWEHNSEVYRADNSVIPTLVLKPFVHPQILINYNKLKTNKNKWIACEQQFPKVSDFEISNWLERLYFERLEQKFIPINQQLLATKQDWEAIMFWQLARGFGAKVNGEAFWSLAKSFPFSVFRKLQNDAKQMEALLFGQSGLLEADVEDPYFIELKSAYAFLKQKHQLSNYGVLPIKFFRLRPPNFPTIRLAQLVQLYHKNTYLFSKVIQANSYEELHRIFQCSTSDFWHTHYNFKTLSAKRIKKRLSKSFVDLLIINSVLPIKYAYQHVNGQDQDPLILILKSIPSEQNSIVKSFNALKPISKTALNSQALIELKNNYCSKLKCLQCGIGSVVLNQNV
jgi:hypothetical protein